MTSVVSRRLGDMWSLLGDVAVEEIRMEEQVWRRYVEAWGRYVEESVSRHRGVVVEEIPNSFEFHFFLSVSNFASSCGILEHSPS